MNNWCNFNKTDIIYSTNSRDYFCLYSFFICVFSYYFILSYYAIHVRARARVRVYLYIDGQWQYNKKFKAIIKLQKLWHTIFIMLTIFTVRVYLIVSWRTFFLMIFNVILYRMKLFKKNHSLVSQYGTYYVLIIFLSIIHRIL